MRRYRNGHDDDDDIVKDGEVVRVRMWAMDGMDSVQRSVCSAGSPVRDGQGGTRGLHRPGFRVAVGDARKTTTVRDPRGRLKETWETEEEEADAAMRARDAAYADYDRRLTTAYLNPVGSDIGKHDAAPVSEEYEEGTCPDCGGSGEINGQECRRCEGSGEVDDEYEDEPDAVVARSQTNTEGTGRRRDHRSIGQRMADHQQRMNDEYRRYDDWVRSQWKQR